LQSLNCIQTILFGLNILDLGKIHLIEAWKHIPRSAVPGIGQNQLERLALENVDAFICDIERLA
jgi:hypothetical protein